MKKISRAFTLVEVIVSIAVLSIGVMAVAAFFASSSTLTHLASNESIAANLAQGYVDDTLSNSYDDLAVGQSTKEKVTTDTASPLYNFSKQTTISLIDADLNQSTQDIGLKKIQVVISYQERGNEKNVTLATIKTKK